MDLNGFSPAFKYEPFENSAESANEQISTANFITKLNSPEKTVHPLLIDTSRCETFHYDTLPKISSEYHHTDVSDVDSSYKSSDSMDVEELSGTSTDDSVKQDLFCNVTVSCLQSYDDLEKTCNSMGLRFVDSTKDECLLKITEDMKSEYNLKSCSVKCLQSIEDLEKECEKLNLYFNSGKVYEVDMILEDKIEEGEKFYLVKWKNYELKYNTWEPEYHLTGCQVLISYYESIRKSSPQLTKDMLVHFISDLTTRKPYDFLTLTKLCNIISDTSEDRCDNTTITQLRLKVKKVFEIPHAKLFKIKNKLLELMRFSEKRKCVLLNLKEWEKNLNYYNPSPYIEVENNVDLEIAPDGFQFIFDYMANDIEICEEPVAFCDCDDCYSDRKSCCPLDSDAHFAYNKYRRLQLLPGYPVYECNKKCKCGKDCINRVVQNGQHVKVAIFRTSNGCGWGLKTLETIQKDQFVLEYLGEILTSEEAELRGNIYDYVGRSYLFDLDYGEENCKYTVDAGHFGNASHFINHSCDPNLHVFAVWINQQDPHLPRLAFFAKRKINRGEELTFDYKMVKNHDRFGLQDSELEERIP
ncbi:histone-lysine N-methyltransferase SUV39H2, partial [Trichonephila clavata]